MRITKRRLERIIREERRRLAEDHIDTELDHLRKNIEDDKEHIDNLEQDIKDDRDEEERAHHEDLEHEKAKHEGRRRRRTSKLGYRQLRRMIREEHDAHYGMGAGEESRTHPGEEDYTGHAGDESKTEPGHLDYEDDATGRAHDAIAAIHDLASAAGVELDVTAGDAGPPDEVAYEEAGVTMESRRRRRRSKTTSMRESQLRRLVRQSLRSR
jgi:Mg2+ and Co2+ transporter CorA